MVRDNGGNEYKLHLNDSFRQLHLGNIKFEVAKGFEDKEINLPRRSDVGSAGYDIESAEDVTIEPHGEMIWDGHDDEPSYINKPTIISTGIKAHFPKGVVLQLILRSSMGIKKGLSMPNSIGVIDSSYANNPDNDGEIMVAVYNFSDEPVHIQKGDRIAQGLFLPFLVTVDDNPKEGTRAGGIGSSGR